MPGVQLIRALLEQATATGYKSTVLNPLGWAMLTLVAATLTSFYISTPFWVSLGFSICTLVNVILYFFAYTYFMFKDKDALRSEKYSIQKLAIEKGIIGDSLHGVLNPEETSISHLLGEAGNKEKELPQ